MKKHKMEIAALTLLLGVLCYAFYDCNIKDNEQEIVLSKELLSMREIKNKEDITTEMLAIPTEDLLKLREEEKAKEESKKTTEEAKKESEEETTTLALNEEMEAYSTTLTATQENIPYNEVISNQVVNYALNFVGNPYVYGGNSLTNGTDCSGFTMLVYANFGVSLPRSAPDQAYAGRSVGLDNIMPGDIVVSGYDGVVCHAALYIGNGQLVHALNSNVGIVAVSYTHLTLPTT